MDVSQSPVIRRIEGVLWWGFVGWSVLGIMALMLGLGKGPLPPWFRPGEVADFLARITPYAEFVWVILGSLTIALLLVRIEGWSSTIIQTCMILLMAGSVGWIGAVTGYPFGARNYGEGLGPLIGGRFPYAMPLIALIVVISARYAFAQWRRGRGWLRNSIGVGVLATLTAVNMNFVAGIRDYWAWRQPAFHEPGDLYWNLWYPLAWFLLCFTLNLFSAPTLNDQTVHSTSAKRLAITFLLLNGTLASLHFGNPG